MLIISVPTGFMIKLPIAFFSVIKLPTDIFFLSSKEHRIGGVLRYDAQETFVSSIVYYESQRWWREWVEIAGRLNDKLYPPSSTLYSSTLMSVYVNIK